MAAMCHCKSPVLKSRNWEEDDWIIRTNSTSRQRPRCCTYRREVLPTCTLPTQNNIPQRDDKIRCCQKLKRAISQCSEMELVQLSCSISIILRSTRNLNRDELFPATTLAASSQSQDDGSLRRLRDEDVQNSTAFELIFKIEDCGSIVFADRAMTDLLMNFGIAGIDASHDTIAYACQRQEWLNEAVPLPEDLQMLSRHRMSAFSSYARENMQHHFAEAGFDK